MVTIFVQELALQFGVQRSAVLSASLFGVRSELKHSSVSCQWFLYFLVTLRPVNSYMINTECILIQSHQSIRLNECRKANGCELASV